MDSDTAPPTEKTEYLLSEEVETFMKDFDKWMKDGKTFLTKLKAVRKEVLALEKKSKKGKKRSTGSTNNNRGFKRPVSVSPDLKSFLCDELLPVVQDLSKKDDEDKDKLEMLLEKLERLQTNDEAVLARTNVTQLMSAYVKYHDLQFEDRKKYIDLDKNEYGEKLKALLSPVVDEDGNPTDLTFMGIQKYIKHHFLKETTQNLESKVETLETKVETLESKEENLESKVEHLEKDIPKVKSVKKVKTEVKKRPLAKKIKKPIKKNVTPVSG